MASITATWSPSSPQLRLALKCGNRRKFPAILQSRVGKWDRRFRVLCVAQDGGGNGKGLERTPIEGSWVGADSKIDGFSGWSNSEDEEQSANSHKKAWYGGEGISGTLVDLISLYFFSWQLKMWEKVWTSSFGSLSTLLATSSRSRFEVQLVKCLPISKGLC